jgi:hypothetical protein
VEIIQGNVSYLVDSCLRKSTINADVQRLANLLEELLSLRSGELTLSDEGFLSEDDHKDISAHVSTL